MRLPALSIGICLGILGVAWAQNSDGGGTVQQLPIGQVFKNFEVPIYQDGILKYTVTASQAKGITQNRAETTDLKIDLYDKGVVTTKVTSPKADLYVAERKLRTKDTVQIIRGDMEASAQSCDFDLLNKKYVLRTNVRVIFKNFDTGPALSPTPKSQPSEPTPPSSAPSTNALNGPTATAPEVLTTPVPASPAPSPTTDSDSLPDSAGTDATTNAVPLTPTSTAPK